MKCAVIACRNSHRSRPEGLSFHKFPEDEEIQRMWKNAIGRDNLIVTKCSFVCSDHFLFSDMVRHRSKTILREGAIPSLNFSLNDGKPRSSHTEVFYCSSPNQAAYLQPETSSCLPSTMVLSTPTLSKVADIGEVGVDSEFMNDGNSEATIRQNNVCNVSGVETRVQPQAMHNPSSFMMFPTTACRGEPESIGFKTEMNCGVTENTMKSIPTRNMSPTIDFVYPTSSIRAQPEFPVLSGKTSLKIASMGGSTGAKADVLDLSMNKQKNNENFGNVRAAYRRLLEAVKRYMKAS